MTARILHIIPDLGSGGAQKLLVDLVDELDETSFESLVAPMYDPTGGENLPRKAQVRSLGKKPGFDRTILLKLSRTVSSFKPDVIHTHNYVLPYLLPVLARSSPPVLHTVHTLARVDGATRIGIQLQRQLFRRRRVLPVAVCPAIARDVQTFHDLPFDVTTVMNGVHIAAAGSAPRRDPRLRQSFGAGEDDLLAVFVGRLEPPKDLNCLLTAVAEARRRQGNLRLLIIGEGGMRRSLEVRAASLGLSDVVTFAGQRSDVSTLLASGDIFALPSFYEGLPLALLEAMALGLAVVASNVGGVQDAIEPDQSGVLVPAGNQDAFTAALVKLGKDDSLRSSLGAAAKRRAERLFDVVDMTRSYEHLYERLAHRPEAEGRR